MKVVFDTKKAHQTYKIDNIKVVGVTTALNIINKPALINWAWQCGIDGKDYRKVRDRAANIGSIAHFLCECHVKNNEPDLSQCSQDDINIAETSFLKFLEFWESNGFMLIASEKQMVSNQYRYGGTLDIVAIDKQKQQCLIDLKTSKAVYEENWWQIAAYDHLWFENNILDGGLQRKIICRIGKEERGDFEIQERSNLSIEFDVFLAALNLYNKINKTKEV